MKELAKWIVIEVICIPLCIVGAVACSFGGRMLWLEIARSDLVFAFLHGVFAFILFLLAIGFALALAFMISLTLDVNSEIISEIYAKKRNRN